MSFNEVLRLAELGAGIARLPAIAATGSNRLEPLFDTGAVPVFRNAPFCEAAACQGPEIRPDGPWKAEGIKPRRKAARPKAAAARS